MTFSIITVTYNASRWLERTIQSLIAQNFPAMEYIIIDGGSTDGTVDIIRKYEDHINYWISEPDNGLYEAMNKGMARASGDYVWFLNAGDLFYSENMLFQVAEIIKSSKQPDIVYGETRIIDEQGNDLGARRLKAPEHLDWRSFRNGMLVCHQSFVVKRAIAPEYDLQYSLAADYDWCIRCMKRSSSITNSHLMLSRFLEAGLSTSRRKEGLKERYGIMVKYYGLFSTAIRHLRFAIRFYFAKALKRRV